MKNPNSPKRSDFSSFTDYTKAYSKFYRENNPSYFKKWREKPENAPKYGKRPPSNCPKCNSVLHKQEGVTGKGHCQTCRSNKEAKLEAFRSLKASQIEANIAKRAAKRQRIEERLRAASEKMAEAAAKAIESAKLKARPSALTTGFFLSPAESERFYSQAEPSGDCLIWRGGEFFYVNAIEARPHRLLWFLANGEIPEGMVLGKLCETPNCISLNCRKLETPAELQLRISAPAKEFRDAYRGQSGQTSAKPIPPFSKEMKDHFWSKVDKSSDCWIWTGQKTKDGYGRHAIRSVHFPAHRVAYFLHYGHINNSLQTLHSCDSPFCLNPLHLSQGNNAENHLDSVARNRISSEDFLKRRIIPSESQVAEIKYLTASGIKPNVISRKFGVSVQTISQIIRD
jgi:DNA-directed RNA polymerase subunit M/transcription elongation factor TFIIS